ncbi:high-molecular-weight cytochrome c [Geobacter sp. OR-1]|uniref:cytochrome c3 family protein n=1 Tax=Geobacter sp. OR-1 TaxID=1266765 RepID=UPI0005445115|nr:cytochrome c3 family protein [Geobacter sp. OR-1]GAM08878.1 high-molecular-weight cytochrome c [Geobacter sp. OR-1]
MRTACTWIMLAIATVTITLSLPQKAAAIPDKIDIGSLEALYKKVNFDHAAHIKTIYDCAVCHHHTTGALVTDPNCVRCHKTSNPTKDVACRNCHRKDPFSADVMNEKLNPNRYHNDIPGLKGAYHQSCLGCHKKMNGPTGCQDCHKRKPEGDAMFNAGEFAPKKPAGKGHGGH